MTDAPSDAIEALVPKLPVSVPLEFNESGVLPPGDYPMTFHELRSSILVHGPSGRTSGAWDRDWRLTLVNNLEVLVRQLWMVGVDEIYIDGSFVEDKDHPNDIDGYFPCGDPGQSLAERAKAVSPIAARLNQLDPCNCWTWDRNCRRPYRGQPKWQLPMWHNHRVELYPDIGQFFGIPDEFGNQQLFPAAFRKTRGAPPVPKGIVRIVKVK